jgi:hypothetical protein
MAENDSRPLVRMLGIVSGSLGGVGAYCFQWALRNPGRGVAGGLMVMLAEFCGFLGFALASIVATGALAVTIRAQRRVWFLPLYVAASFLAALYALGGSWPFWQR